MTDDLDQAHQDAQAAADAGVAGLLEGVADRIGQHAGATAAFGEPVERDGLTVIPVAQVVIGMGAGGGITNEVGDGEGDADGEASTGSGAGGGAMSRPLGYIEVSAEGARFVPLNRPWANPPLVLAYALLALVVARTLVRIVRG